MEVQKLIRGLATVVFAVPALLGLSPTAGYAQSYPTKPIKLIVPFAAGGTTDMLGRLVAQKISESWGQPVVVENKPGAGTNIGVDLVAKSPGDGYTLLMGTPSIAVNPGLYESLPYDWQKDLAPVTMVGFVPNILVVHPSLPVSSVKDLISYAKANPGKLTFASSGVGGAIHLSGELFKILAEVDMVHVPYRGSAPAMADLVGGRISLMFDNLPSAFPQVKAGKLRGIAVTSARRSSVAPDLPTVSEAGLSGFDVVSWNGIFVPTKTPPEIISRLRNEIARIVALPDVKERFASQGIEAGGNAPAEFAAFVKAEADKWQGLVRRAGIKAD